MPANSELFVGLTAKPKLRPAGRHDGQTANEYMLFQLGHAMGPAVPASGIIASRSGRTELTSMTDIPTDGDARGASQQPETQEPDEPHFRQDKWVGMELIDRAPYATRLRVILLLSLAGWALIALAVAWIAGRL